MTLSVDKSYVGPIWCLGNIIVTVPGTPVSIMSLVDSSNANAPGTQNFTGTGKLAYSTRAMQIQFPSLDTLFKLP